jgi:hypothetical protein
VLVAAVGVRDNDSDLAGFWKDPREHDFTDLLGSGAKGANSCRFVRV